MSKLLKKKDKKIIEDATKKETAENIIKKIRNIFTLKKKIKLGTFLSKKRKIAANHYQQVTFEAMIIIISNMKVMGIKIKHLSIEEYLSKIRTHLEDIKMTLKSLIRRKINEQQ